MTKQEHMGAGAVKAEGGHASINDRTGLLVSIAASILAALALGYAANCKSLAEAYQLMAQQRIDAAQREFDQQLRDEKSKAHDAETQSMLVISYLTDPAYRSQQDIAAWQRFKKDHNVR